MPFKLLVDEPPVPHEFVLEKKNTNDVTSLYISGPYMMANEKNKNNRIYTLEEMAKDVERYKSEMITTKRAMGELNHPTTVEVDLERACHVVTELKQDGNFFIGKSRVLSTPCGTIMKNLIEDGVSVGMSTRALGRLEEKNGVNYVHDMRLIAIDCVADPSCPKAFVNGILESKQWIIRNDGKYEELYDSFENSLKTLPRKDTNEYLVNQLNLFFKELTKK